MHHPCRTNATQPQQSETPPNGKDATLGTVSTVRRQIGDGTQDAARLGTMPVSL
eukprot:COSAG02_NODE_57206_length_281_cov_1.131868_1_plen_53_part_10